MTYTKEAELFNDKKKNLYIIVFSFLIVFFKWLISFYIFSNESLVNKVIFDVKDYYYFSHIINLSDLNFFPNYLQDVEPNKLMPIPIYSILFHSLLYKFLGLYTFFLLEFISLTIFLYIFTKIFNQLDFNNSSSIILSILIFILPFILVYGDNLKLNFINFEIFKSLYSFRFPRPLITSLYFFWGLYLAIKYFLNENNSLKTYIYIGICLSLCFVSFYYNFINLLILFFIIFLIKIFRKKNFLVNDVKKIIISIIIFIVLISPFLILIFFSEKDYSIMIGVIELNYERKITLLSYLFGKILSLRFIMVFLVLSTMYFFLNKQKDVLCKKTLLILYMLFLTSAISPFFFILISPAVSEIYHFLNWILINAIFVFSIFLIILFRLWFKKINIKKILKFQNNNSFISVFFFLILILFQTNHYIINQKDAHILRTDFEILQRLLNENKEKLNVLLTFIPRGQIWWILNDKTELSTIESSISSLNFNQLEKSFIDNLKFLNISTDNFQKIISNKKEEWRYDNKYIKYLSYYKYQANSLITYKNSLDFDESEKKYILKSRPTKTQQIMIPNFDIKRLINLYENYESNSKFNDPDIIIVQKNSLIDKFSKINNKLYCQIKNFNFLKVYVKIKKGICN